MRVRRWLALMLLWSAAAQAQQSTVAGAGSTFIVDFSTGYRADRMAVFESAAQHWADLLYSAVPIRVSLTFEDSNDLACNKSSATLGLGGATTLHRGFRHGIADTYYPQALANALAGYDLATSEPDISIRFNARLDDNVHYPNCLGGGDWYYGYAVPAGNDVSFYHTAMHELAHGLGFQTFADFDTGALFQSGDPAQGYNDHFLIHLLDLTTGKTLDKDTVSDAQRAAAARDDGKLVWNGAAATAASTVLSAGVNNGKVQMYAPSTYIAGSSVTHFDTRLSPDELMEPNASPLITTAIADAVMADIGWAMSDAEKTPPVVASAAAAVAPVRHHSGGGGGFLFGGLLCLLLYWRRQ